MDYIFVFFGMTTQLIFLYRRELLLDKKVFFYILYFNVFLFILGFIFEDFLKLDFKAVGILKMSLLSQLIFLIMIYIYKILYKKNPADTFWVSDITLLKDGIFNFIFWIAGTLIPVIIILG